MNVKVFKNEKAKKPIDEFFLKLKKANTNLFPVSRMAVMHPYEHLENLMIDKNVIVDQAFVKSENLPNPIEISLIEYKNVSLELKLPKKLKSSGF